MVWPERKASDISRAVGDVVYGAYKRQRLSQAALVERTGISVTTMRRLIAGEAEFDVDQLFAISNALGISAADILAEAEKDVSSAAARTGGPSPDREDLQRAATADTELDTDEHGVG